MSCSRPRRNSARCLPHRAQLDWAHQVRARVRRHAQDRSPSYSATFRSTAYQVRDSTHPMIAFQQASETATARAPETPLRSSEHVGPGTSANVTTSADLSYARGRIAQRDALRSRQGGDQERLGTHIVRPACAKNLVRRLSRVQAATPHAETERHRRSKHSVPRIKHSVRRT